MIPLAYNLRNLRVRKSTTAAAALGLALVVFIFASVQMLGNGIKNATKRASDPSVAIVLRKGAGTEMESGIDLPSAALVAALPGVARFPNGRPEAIGELVAVAVMDRRGGSGFSNVQIRGIADETVAFRRGVKIVAGRAAAPGTGEVIVGKQISGRFKGLEVGQTFELRRNHPVRVVGVFEDDGSAFESEVWGDVAVIREVFGRGAIVSSMRVRLEAPEKLDTFKAALDANRQLQLAAMPEDEFFEKTTRGTTTFLRRMGLLIAFFFSLGAILGAMVTMHATVADREREIGTLRALGFTRGQVLVSFLVESVALALLGGVVGAGASLAMSLVHISLMNSATYSELAFRFEPSPRIILSAMVAAGVMGILGGGIPAVRAALVSPVRAMRGA